MPEIFYHSNQKNLIPWYHYSKGRKPQKLFQEVYLTNWSMVNYHLSITSIIGRNRLEESDVFMEMIL